MTDSGTDTVLVIDNYDSFVYNLVQYVGALVSPQVTGDSPGPTDWRSDGAVGAAVVDKPASGSKPPTGPGDGAIAPAEVIVRRNDAVDLTAVDAIDPAAIVVSPGPGRPEDAGITPDLFARREYPTLGVCLGHQALCAENGGAVGHAPAVVHGKPSTITHDGEGIFRGLPDRFEVGRYHSLAVERADLPATLTETASTVDETEVVMAVRHEDRPHVGVQFHPESILTADGMTLIANFLEVYAQ